MYRLWFLFLPLLVACGSTQTASTTEAVDSPHARTHSIKLETSDVQISNMQHELPLEDYLRQVSGVMVTGQGPTARIRIRGMANSISSGQEPLFVVDGMQVEGFDAVSGMVLVADIERVSVLKDGSSTAIYGTRGSNGVIYIQTKQRASE